jgi:hypothetical protein
VETISLPLLNGLVNLVIHLSPCTLCHAAKGEDAWARTDCQMLQFHFVVKRTALQVANVEKLFVCRCVKSSDIRLKIEQDVSKQNEMHSSCNWNQAKLNFEICGPDIK